MRSDNQRYTGVAVMLHWLIALIVVVNLAIGLTHDVFMDSIDAQMKALGRTLIDGHKALGLIAIALTLVRIGWRLGHPPPPLPAHMTPLERGLARTVHGGFYALLLLLPLSGWAMVSARAVPAPVSVFGLFAMPPLPLPAAARSLFDTSHAVLGWTMLVTLVLHVLAAAKHQILDRDPLLARMWL